MNKNILKLLAALTMVIDHAGLLLFPQVAVLRWIGRISFPLFAFCVGDGCAYTRKPRAYLLRVLGLGSPARRRSRRRSCWAAVRCGARRHCT